MHTREERSTGSEIQRRKRGENTRYAHAGERINPVSWRESKAEFSRLASVNICPWVAHYTRVVMRSNYALCVYDSTHRTLRVANSFAAVPASPPREIYIFTGLRLLPLLPLSHDRSPGRIKRYSYSCNATECSERFCRSKFSAGAHNFVSCVKIPYERLTCKLCLCSRVLFNFFTSGTLTFQLPELLIASLYRYTLPVSIDLRVDTWQRSSLRRSFRFWEGRNDRYVGRLVSRAGLQDAWLLLTCV